MTTSANRDEGETEEISMTATVAVRDASVLDVGELAALAASAWHETYRTMIDKNVTEAVVAQTCTVEAFTRLIEADASGAGYVLVATEYSSIVAFLDFRFEANRAELCRLYGAPGETGRGLGSRLIEALECRLDSIDEYEVTVVAANVRALSFWQRHGCQPVSRVSVVEHFGATRGVCFDAAADGGDLIKMRRRLSLSRDEAA
jgi:GNAT superfamily N-acetyltransferase